MRTIKRKLIEVKVKGRSGFSGNKTTFKRFIKPYEYKSYKKELGNDVKKTGRVKTKRFIRFG